MDRNEASIHYSLRRLNLSKSEIEFQCTRPINHSPLYQYKQLPNLNIRKRLIRATAV